MSSVKHCFVQNGGIKALSDVPCLAFSEFQQYILDAVAQEWRVCSFFGMEMENADNRTGQPLRLIAVLANEAEKRLAVMTTQIEKHFPSFTTAIPQFHMFEREIAEQWGVTPVGHPWLRPARFHESYRKGTDIWPGLPQELFRIEGGEAHEVAVGPIHAGVIEPGHFRFQCHGEKVFHLEISLGYQHRGIEKTLFGGPHKRTAYQMEALAGDTTIGHFLAYCQAMEALQGVKVPPRAHALRAVGLELERLANHTGDLGALGGDVGYLPTSSYCGRIRGDFLNMTALICGSRLGRGFISPRGVRFDLDTPERLEKLCQALARAEKDSNTAIQLLWDSPTVMNRFENTGRVSKETCLALGLVGPTARACGALRDIRHDFPLGHYQTAKFPTEPRHESMTGDVAARALVRWHEMHDSLRFLQELLPNLPAGGIASSATKAAPPLRPNSLVVSLVEGWRGEICHTAITDAKGHFSRYKVVDPSFHNWIALGMALRNQEISDFPLCNKSFNLSYCGFDL
ncbi:MAG: NADH-quinone oxidoreductase subunit C [Candidatus Riflebacteria bacterium]|nr:NADH-quinone oxidoreductase subunit C [Candidatus Riflebacteria bacterium]